MVQTPKYWEKKRFQPLAEAKTMYGNKVQIPKNLKDAWEYYEQATKTTKTFSQGKMDGCLKQYGKNSRSIIFTNLLQVYEEMFKEDKYSERMLTISEE